MRFKELYYLTHKPTANSTSVPEKTTRRQELIARIQKLKAAKMRSET